MRLVFFLGAGFSRSAGFPLMHEFSMFSQGLTGYEKHIDCLHKCIEYAQRTRAYIHGDIYNIEYLMSVLSLAAITNPELEFSIGSKRVRVGEALETLKALVWRIYSRMDDVVRWEGEYARFRRVLGQFLDDKRNSIDIVTTNYDLLPEMIMYKVGEAVGMPAGFEEMKLPEGFATTLDLARHGGRDYSMYRNGGRNSLHKLHGSANWFVKNRGKQRTVYGWDQLFLPIDTGRFFCIPFCTTKGCEIPKGCSPVIVPPSMIKEYKVPVIKKAWQGASESIANADKIVFIGYSFPPTDTIMKFFLGTSLANNHKGCRISIIDKNATGVMNSLKSVFVEDICHRIHPINIEFAKLLTDAFQPWTSFREYLTS